MTDFRMRLAIGSAGFAILAAFAAAGPFGAPRIEALVEASARKELAAQGAPWISVRAAGRDIRLLGVAPDEPGLSALAALVRDLPATARVDSSAVDIASRPLVPQPAAPARVAAEPDPQPAALPLSDPQACQSGVNRTLNGRRLTFDAESAQLRDAERAILDALSNALSVPECEGLILVIEGHTDASGSEASNLDLSARRAKAVRDHLSAGARTAVTLIERAEGETRPIASNNNAAGRAANRRIDFIIERPAGESE